MFFIHTATVFQTIGRLILIQRDVCALIECNAENQRKRVCMDLRRNLRRPRKHLQTQSYRHAGGNSSLDASQLFNRLFELIGNRNAVF